MDNDTLASGVRSQLRDQHEDAQPDRLGMYLDDITDRLRSLKSPMDKALCDYYDAAIEWPSLAADHAAMLALDHRIDRAIEALEGRN